MAKIILVVDDEEGMLELLQCSLRLRGYDVIAAADGPTALRLAIEENPALVVLDIAMPGMSGWEVLAHLESDPHTAGIPVIMLSALSSDDEIVRGLEMGAVDYITKPFDLRHLMDTVQLVSEQLDTRGQEAYRRALMSRRKQLMRSLNGLFPKSSAPDEAEQRV